jgi:hypothetical protein
MTWHDPCVRTHRGTAWRARWFGLRRGLGLSAPKLPAPRLAGPYPPGPAPRAAARDRRRLSGIERALTTGTPALASMFTMFNQLTEGEAPAGVERVPPPGWPRSRALHLAVLLTLAAIAALCVTLSTQLHSAAHSCPAAAVAGTTISAPVHGLTCHAYATSK